MKPLCFAFAIAAAIVLASSAETLAQGKGSGDTPSATPSDRPSDTRGDRPGGAPGSAIGGRDAPAESEPPPAARTEPPPSPERWNSIASAIWRVRGRVRVAIGYSGARSSSDDARASALEACRDAGGSGCKALGAWSAGCVYITTGHAVNRAGWASGATSDAALKKCRGDGFTCKPPIGGCVD
jgi:hypothetical protein